MAKLMRGQSVENICELPVELLELIMSYISYDEIAKIRLVCRQFDSCSQRLLNRGFVKVEKFHGLCFKKVKAQLPRRESERRNHPLARHCDVLSAIETRLSLLGMTYMKYVEMNLCCFIPGKVIDEIYRVLRFIQGNQNPPRVHELLQELRDISSMAMEYFEEKIAPSLKSRLSASSSVISVSMNSSAMNRSFPNSGSNTSPHHYQGTQRTNSLLENETKTSGVVKQIQTSQNTIKKELTEIKIKMKDFSQLKREFAQIKIKLKDSDKASIEKDQTIAELKSELEDLKRRMNEVDKKNGLKSINDDHDHKESKTSRRKPSKSPKKATTTRAKSVKKTSPKSESKEVAKPITGLRRSSRRSSEAASISLIAMNDNNDNGLKNAKRKQNVDSNANKRSKKVKI